MDLSNLTCVAGVSPGAELGPSRPAAGSSIEASEPQALRYDGYNEKCQLVWLEESQTRTDLILATLHKATIPGNTGPEHMGRQAAYITVVRCGLPTLFGSCEKKLDISRFLDH